MEGGHKDVNLRKGWRGRAGRQWQEWWVLGVNLELVTHTSVRLSQWGDLLIPSQPVLAVVASRISPKPGHSNQPPRPGAVTMIWWRCPAAGKRRVTYHQPRPTLLSFSELLSHSA